MSRTGRSVRSVALACELASSRRASHGASLEPLDIPTECNAGKHLSARYRYVTPRGPLGYLDRLGQLHGWRSVVERALILLIVAGVVIGLLILSSGNHANVFCNISGSPGQ